LTLVHARRGDPDGDSTLVAALIARQDAMSRRTAARITAILDAYMPAADAARLWISLAEPARARLAAIPDECAAVGLSSPGVVTLRTMIAEILTETLVVTEEDRAHAAEPPSTEPRPVVVRSRTLARARAQSASLMARLIDLKGRIAKPGTVTLGGRRV
jgi:hypothetical protein